MRNANDIKDNFWNHPLKEMQRRKKPAAFHSASDFP